jgi:hypothetical protein
MNVLPNIEVTGVISAPFGSKYSRLVRFRWCWRKDWLRNTNRYLLGFKFFFLSRVLSFKNNTLDVVLYVFAMFTNKTIIFW